VTRSAVSQARGVVPSSARNRRCSVAGLAPVAVAGEDQPAAHRVGDLGAVIMVNQVQAEVQGGRAAGRRQHRPVLDEQHVGLEPDPGIAAGELRPAPARGRPAPVEDPGVGQRERAGAEADQACPAGGGPGDGGQDGRAGSGARGSSPA